MTRQQAATRAHQIINEMRGIYGVPSSLIEELQTCERDFYANEDAAEIVKVLGAK